MPKSFVHGKQRLADGQAPIARLRDFQELFSVPLKRIEQVHQRPDFQIIFLGFSGSAPKSFNGTTGFCQKLVEVHGLLSRFCHAPHFKGKID
jgi:hypothetical protein